MKGVKSKTSKERPKYNMWQNTAYMVKEAWNTRKSVLALCLFTTVLAVLNSLAELFIAPAILHKVETTAPLSELLWVIGLFSGALLLLAALRSYTEQNTLFGRIEVRFSILQHIHKKAAATSFPNSEDTAVLKKREKAMLTVSTNAQPTEAIWAAWSELLKNIAGFVIYLLLLSALDILLFAVVLLSASCGYFAARRIQAWEFQHREEEAEYLKKMNYVSSKTKDIALAKDIRIFGMRSWLEDVYRSTLRLYHAFIARREKKYILIDLVNVFLTLLRNGAAYFYLITMVLTSDLSASQFLLYFSAVSGFAAWITGILTGFSTLHKQSLELSAMREYLETPEPFLFDEGEPLQADKSKAYELRLQNVRFRYPGAEQDTLHGLNLTIRPGEKLAIVGLNGAGKTTLVKLLCGFYDPTEGEVLLNGENIKKFNRRHYYRMFSAVFQHFSVPEATLAENVAQACENIDMKKLKDCLEKAGLTEKAASLPQGLDTHIGRSVFEEGTELSGGERQRLMLARALYKDAPIIVLDEPTAALDPIAENDLYLKYNEMTKGRTSVYISHRLASTRFCDRIIFLADGNIAEEGTHESLMELGGEYAALFRVQSRYYQEGSEF